MTALFVALGAVIGAPLRYLVDRSIQSRHDSVFPWGTLTVNVAASFMLGFVTGAASGTHVASGIVTLVGPGFCGALSTYSTLGYETVRLAEEGSLRYAAANVVVSVVLGLGAAWGGVALAMSSLELEARANGHPDTAVCRVRLCHVCRSAHARPFAHTAPAILSHLVDPASMCHSARRRIGHRQCRHLVHSPTWIQLSH